MLESGYHSIYEPKKIMYVQKYPYVHSHITVVSSSNECKACPGLLPAWLLTLDLPGVPTNHAVQQANFLFRKQQGQRLGNPVLNCLGHG